jgi:DNA polymerase-3 subunit alpha
VAAIRLSRDLVGRLRGVLANHPGTVPVYLHMGGDGDDTVVRLGPEYRVEPRTALYAELRELLGPESILR